MISTATPTEHLGRAFGVHRMLDTIGAALGPLIAFGLLVVVPDGYSVVLVVSLAFALAGVALLGLLGPDVRARRDRERSSGPTPPPFRWRDLTDARLRPLLAGRGRARPADGRRRLHLPRAARPRRHQRHLVPPLLRRHQRRLPAAGRAGRPPGRPRRTGPHPGRWATSPSSAPTCAPSCPPRPPPPPSARCSCWAPSTPRPTASSPPSRAGSSPCRRASSGIAAAQTVVALARMLASAGFGLLWLLLGPTVAMATVAALLVLAVLAAATRIRAPRRRRGHHAEPPAPGCWPSSRSSW